MNFTNWLIQSGLKVNEDKTGLCLFYKNDTTPISITLKGKVIESVNSMNVLGVIFDSKLSWTNHVALAINKAQNALNALKLIRRFFTHKQLLQLVTSNFYSVLFTIQKFGSLIL